MLKYIILFLFTISALSVTAQQLPGTFTQPNNSRGITYNGLRAIKEFYGPVLDTTFTPQWPFALVMRPADAAAKNGIIYIWTGARWQQIQGSGGGSTDTTSLSNRINQRVSAISKPNDSTIRFTIGGVDYDIVDRGGSGSGGASYVFSNGLTNTGGNVRNDLITGKGSSQDVIGGANANGGLRLLANAVDLNGSINALGNFYTTGDIGYNGAGPGNPRFRRSSNGYLLITNSGGTTYGNFIAGYLADTSNNWNSKKGIESYNWGNHATVGYMNRADSNLYVTRGWDQKGKDSLATFLNLQQITNRGATTTNDLTTGGLHAVSTNTGSSYNAHYFIGRSTNARLFRTGDEINSERFYVTPGLTASMQELLVTGNLTVSSGVIRPYTTENLTFQYNSTNNGATLGFQNNGSQLFPFRLSGNNVQLPLLANSGTRMLTVDNSGNVSAQAIPSGGGGGASVTGPDYGILKSIGGAAVSDTNLYVKAGNILYSRNGGFDMAFGAIGSLRAYTYIPNLSDTFRVPNLGAISRLYGLKQPATQVYFAGADGLPTSASTFYYNAGTATLVTTNRFETGTIKTAPPTGSQAYPTKLGAVASNEWSVDINGTVYKIPTTAYAFPASGGTGTYNDTTFYFTTGSTWTIPPTTAKEVEVYIRPGSTVSTGTIVFPTTMYNRQRFNIHFGGGTGVTSGAVVNNINFTAAGKTIGGTSTLDVLEAYETITLYYDLPSTTLHR